MEDKIEKYQRDVIAWLVANKNRLLFIVFTFIVSKTFSVLPYFNLKLKDPFHVFAPGIFLIIVLINMNYRKLFFVIVVTTFLSALIFLLLRVEIAEEVANYLYIVFLGIIIKGIFS